jgi:hypothetical protein
MEREDQAKVIVKHTNARVSKPGGFAGSNTSNFLIKKTPM